MASFNKVMLMGNLTRDPQMKNLPSNTVVAEFGLACNRKYKTASGEDKEETAFVDCTAFGRQAEVIGQHCVKGKPIFVEGRLKYDTWDDKMGNGKRSKLSVVVENFQFIGGRDQEFPADMFMGGGASGAGNGGGNKSRRGGGEQGQMWADRSDSPDAQPEKAAPRKGRAARAGQNAPEQPYGEEKQFEEADIPF